MNSFLLCTVLACFSATHALEVNTVTGPTPPPHPCPQTLCAGKEDGNHVIEGDPHYFVQCVKGIASCQSCWPHSLVFKLECNQCLYKLTDECVTTQPWVPQSTFSCPNLCPNKNIQEPFSGNMADPNQPGHYIACWKGKTRGCIRCPGDLQYNEQWDACLWGGEHFTKPH